MRLNSEWRVCSEWKVLRDAGRWEMGVAVSDAIEIRL